MSLVAPPPIAAAREDALERLLSDIAVSVRSQQRIVASVDEVVALEPDTLSLIYVLAGEIRVLGDDRFPDAFTTGDALLGSGLCTATLRIPADSRVLVSRLELAAGASHLGTLLPPMAWIRGFDDLEPAAAALAQHLGSRCRTGTSNATATW